MEPRASAGSEEEKTFLGADVPRWYSRTWLIPDNDLFVPRGAHRLFPMHSTVSITWPASDHVFKMGGL